MVTQDYIRCVLSVSSMSVARTPFHVLSARARCSGTSDVVPQRLIVMVILLGVHACKDRNRCKEGDDIEAYSYMGG